MAKDRPHARHAAKQRARQAQRRRLMLLIGVPLFVALVVVVAVVVSGGDSSVPPEPGSPDQVAAGEDVFVANCATCHGEGLRGGLAGPPLINEIYAPSHHPDSAIRAAIANGVTPHHWDFAGMPPITGLSDDDVDAVIAYIRAVQRDAWDAGSP